jgi:hypothetical protein
MAVVVAMVLCTAGSAPAGITVVCNGNGTACGGSGPRDYWYEVTTTQQYEQFHLHVASGDPVVGNYSNMTAAKFVGGTWVEMVYRVDYDCFVNPDNPAGPFHTPMTLHGGGPVTPTGNCRSSVDWNVNGPVPAGKYGFGYDNSTAPMDVLWDVVYAPHMFVSTDWSKVVGMGQGPVHGPSPEPATLSLLAVGIGTLLLKKRRA